MKNWAMPRGALVVGYLRRRSLHSGSRQIRVALAKLLRSQALCQRPHRRTQAQGTVARRQRRQARPGCKASHTTDMTQSWEPGVNKQPGMHFWHDWTKPIGVMTKTTRIATRTNTVAATAIAVTNEALMQQLRMKKSRIRHRSNFCHSHKVRNAHRMSSSLVMQKRWMCLGVP